MISKQLQTPNIPGFSWYALVIGIILSQCLQLLWGDGEGAGEAWVVLVEVEFGGQQDTVTFYQSPVPVCQVLLWKCQGEGLD